MAHRKDGRLSLWLQQQWIFATDPSFLPFPAKSFCIQHNDALPSSRLADHFIGIAARASSWPVGGWSGAQTRGRQALESASYCAYKSLFRAFICQALIDSSLLSCLYRHAVFGWNEDADSTAWRPQRP